MESASEVRAVLQQAVDALSRDYNPEKVVLFGSCASGVAHEDSDVDLIIIRKTDLPSFRRGAQVQRLIRHVHGSLPMDIIVMTPKELTTQLKRGNVFLEQVLREGEVLFEQARVKAS